MSCIDEAMDAFKWLSTYNIVRRYMGYDLRADRLSASLLDIVAGMNAHDCIVAARRLIEGADVVVVGPAVSEVEALRWFESIIVADSGYCALRNLGIEEPDIIVTDLDGIELCPPPENYEGVVFLHAHGDNFDRIKRTAPLIPGCIVPTVQVEPRGRSLMLGGFTDGDRAVSIACMLGARSIHLLGWNLEGLPLKNGPNWSGLVKRSKIEKNAWARRMINLLRAEGCPITGEGV